MDVKTVDTMGGTGYLSSFGCDIYRPERIGQRTFSEAEIETAVDQVLSDAREEDIIEWSHALTLTGASLRDVLIESMRTTRCPRIITDETNQAVALLGVSKGGWLWSFWGKPKSSKVLKAAIKHFPDLLLELKSSSGYYFLKNYILKSNTFFTRLLDRSGAGVFDAPEFQFPNYNYFEV